MLPQERAAGDWSDDAVLAGLPASLLGTCIAVLAAPALLASARPPLHLWSG